MSNKEFNLKLCAAISVIQEASRDQMRIHYLKELEEYSHRVSNYSRWERSIYDIARLAIIRASMGSKK